MKNTLLITKYIRAILEQDTELMKKIPIKQFFPIDAKQGTAYPFAVIVRTGLQDNSTKDGIYEDVVTVTIIVVDDNYIDSIEIANEIRNWLEGHTFKDETIYIRRMSLSSTSEAYYNDAFIQELSFNIYVN
ncbi:MAG: hypothetical protein VZR10_05730 [Methanobrevibacter sp.]|nr:hypothetical protein [Methanobrevibacter sp.]